MNLAVETKQEQLKAELFSEIKKNTSFQNIFEHLNTNFNSVGVFKLITV